MTVTARPGVRIAAFVAGLAVVFGAAFGVGVAVGPWDAEPAPHPPAMHSDQEGTHR